MNFSLHTSSSATAALGSLQSTSSLLMRSLARLSSGSRIITPSDDAAGLAVSMKLSAAMRRLGAVRTNIGNALSFLETRDASLQQLGRVLDRISELKVLWSDVTKNDSDRRNYDAELRRLSATIHSIAEERFNGISVFSSQSLTVRAGDGSEAHSAIAIAPSNPLAIDDSPAWRVSGTGIPGNIQGLINIEGTLVGVWGSKEDGVRIATSTNGGRTWRTRLESVPSAFTNGAFPVAYGDGTIIVGGVSGRTFTSQDGIEWKERTSAGAWPFEALHYTGSQWIGVGALGVIQTSPDGKSWTPRANGTVLDKLTSVASIGPAVVAGGTELRHSQDGGVTWADPTTPPPGGVNYTVAAGAGVFVAAGQDGSIHTSTDGVAWSARQAPIDTQFHGVTHTPQGFLAFGEDGVVLASADALTWTQKVALADGGAWTRSTPASGTTTASNGSIQVRADSAVEVSVDGQTWTAPAMPPSGAAHYAVAYGNGQFVVTTDEGTLFTSTNGQTWTERTSPLSTGLTGVEYRDEAFYAYSEDGRMISSEDGQTWALEPLALQGQFARFTEGSSQFAALGSGDPSGDLLLVNSGSGSLFDVAVSTSLEDLDLDTIRDAITQVAALRAQTGAEQNQLGFAAELATVNQANLEQAVSRIQDTDFARESTTLARASILQQSGVAMLRQSTLSANLVLQLLN